ncbi:MAG TPA: hypothetical protein VGJ73_16245 [Verrucomicrobiae bacterium]
MFIAFLLVFFVGISTAWARPQRLIIGMDGISYRDMKALQEGVVYTNFWGVVRRRAFGADEGFFPVSRMISTFPSTSDVAWTDIFGNRPLPGYQRTYYSVAANSEIAVNGLTSTMEHERQMDWQSESDLTRSMGYIYSVHVYDFEVYEMVNSFWNSKSTNANFYAYIRSSDDAQHMDRDVFTLLCTMDQKLQDLRARYKAAEGHDLQILIISDHGHNHAGRGERVQIIPFLEKNGYSVARSIQHSNDVVLPTSGIEDWIEIHNAPAETERLADKLTGLKGMDVLAARIQPDRFLVLNSANERAVIDWNPTNNTFRYSMENGDPLRYGPIIQTLASGGKLEAGGFATANDLMDATITNHYPLALQRIVRGLASVTLNPATILVSLDNHYVHAAALINAGSRLESTGSTHGALDDINSMGIVLSNFTPTHDTSSDRVAACFDNFAGLRDYRAEENGAEWVRKSEQARTRIRRDLFDWNYKSLPEKRIFLRVWSPDLAQAGEGTLYASVEKLSGTTESGADPVNLQPNILHERQYTFGPPISFSQNTHRGPHEAFVRTILPHPQKRENNLPVTGYDKGSNRLMDSDDNPATVTAQYERIYACPTDLALEPFSAYRIAGWVQDGGKSMAHFEIFFNTDGEGRPAPY